jgi:hypothetical protein
LRGNRGAGSRIPGDIPSQLFKAEVEFHQGDGVRDQGEPRGVTERHYPGTGEGFMHENGEDNFIPRRPGSSHDF